MVEFQGNDIILTRGDTLAFTVQFDKELPEGTTARFAVKRKLTDVDCIFVQDVNVSEDGRALFAMDSLRTWHLKPMDYAYDVRVYIIHEGEEEEIRTPMEPGAIHVLPAVGKLKYDIDPDEDYSGEEHVLQYSRLAGLPSINGVELVGDVSSEELGIEPEHYDDSEIREELGEIKKDIALHPKTISVAGTALEMDKNGAVDVPFASASNPGVVSTNGYYGYVIGANGVIVPYQNVDMGNWSRLPTQFWIGKQTLEKYSAMPSLMPALTDAEKKAGRERIGLGDYELIADFALAEDAGVVEIDLLKKYKKFSIDINFDRNVKFNVGTVYIGFERWQSNAYGFGVPSSLTAQNLSCHLEIESINEALKIYSCKHFGYSISNYMQSASPGSINKTLSKTDCPDSGFTKLIIKGNHDASQLFLSGCRMMVYGVVA